MKVGIIGSGGREHAFCELLKKSSKISKIYCIPGNAGTNSIAENINLDISDFKKIKNFILKNKIEIVASKTVNHETSKIKCEKRRHVPGGRRASDGTP